MDKEPFHKKYWWLPFLLRTISGFSILIHVLKKANREMIIPIIDKVKKITCANK